VFDAFSGDEFVGDPLHEDRLPADDKDLEAIVVIKVDVEGRDNDFVMVVLDIGEGRLNVLLVVVVKEGDRAGDFMVAKILTVLNQAGADHIGHRERAVIVALLAGHLVELFGQIAGDGNSETDNTVALSVFHGGDVSRTAGKAKPGTPTGCTR